MLIRIAASSAGPQIENDHIGVRHKPISVLFGRISTLSNAQLLCSICS
jgi:hypothetical protein